MIFIEVHSWPNEMGFSAERNLVLHAEVGGKEICLALGESVGVTELAAWLGQVLAALGHPVALMGHVGDIDPATVTAIGSVPEAKPGSEGWRQPMVLDLTEVDGSCNDCGSHTDRTLWLKGAVEGGIMSWHESGHMQPSKIRSQYASYLWLALTRLGYEVQLAHTAFRYGAENTTDSGS